MEEPQLCSTAGDDDEDHDDHGNDDNDINYHDNELPSSSSSLIIMFHGSLTSPLTKSGASEG